MVPCSANDCMIPISGAGVFPSLLLPLSDLGFPALLDGEYRHSMPHARHLEQIGRAFEHLTLAMKHPSQDCLSRTGRGFELDDMTTRTAAKTLQTPAVRNNDVNSPQYRYRLHGLANVPSRRAGRDAGSRRLQGEDVQRRACVRRRQMF